jgi:iron complex outermembrane recepter protein
MHKVTKLGLLASTAFALTPAHAQPTPASPSQTVGMGAPASAGNDTPETGSAAPSGGLDEIIVTAQRRAENLQTVPVAVTAINEQQLGQRFATDFRDIQGLAPGLVVGTNSAFPGNAQLTIRGLTSGDNEKSFEASVGTVVDGLFIANSTQQFTDLFDVERVEVLRGPQGVLFGKNTIGGVINVIRRRPTEDFNVEAETTLGRFGRNDWRAAVNGAIISGTWASRLTLKSNNSNGFATNTFDGGTRGGLQQLFIRSANLFTLSDDVTFLLNSDFGRDRSQAGPSKNVSRPGQVICSVLRACIDPTQPFFTVDNNVPNKAWVDTINVIGELNWKTGAGTLTSITGFQDMYEDYYGDFDGTRLRFIESLRQTKSNIYSQEVRFASDFSDVFDFVAGGLFYRTTYSLFLDVDLRDNPVTPPRLLQRTSQQADSYAAFGQANLRLLDNRLTFHAGGRYTTETKKFQHCPQAPTECLFGRADAEATFKRFTPKLGVDFKASDEAFLYASYTTGFKAGGFNGRAAASFTPLGVPVPGANIGPYQPERVSSYEIGLKSELFDRRLRLNVAAFEARYKGLQLDVNQSNPIIGQQTLVTNASDAVARGIEAEATAIFSDNFRIDANASYFKGEYRNFIADIVGNGVVTDNSALEFRRSPRFQYFVSATYDIDTQSSGTFSLNAAYGWKGENFLNQQNIPESLQPAIGLLDASVNWSSSDERFGVSVFGKNLTDRRYIDNFFAVGGLNDFGGVNQPLTWGIRLSAKLR